MTPQLRFPEFTDEWQVKKLGDVVDFKNGKPFEDFVRNDGKYNLITIDSVDIKGNLKSKFKKVTKNDSSLKKGDIVTVLSDIAHGKLLGLTATIPENEMYVLNQRMGRLRPEHNDRPNFLSQAINLKQTFFRKRGQGTSQRHIYERDVAQLELTLPTESEQEKIADFLTAVDERIAVGEKKLELLETYKRGVMQKIFSQQVRFKDDNGNPYPDWEEQMLGEITRNFDNKRKPIASEKRDRGDVPYYGANGVVDYVKDYIFDGEYILVAEDGVVDVTKYPVHFVTGKFWANNHAHILQGKSVTNSFLYYGLKNTKFARYITGSAQTKLNNKVLSKIKISTPVQEEQQKIAAFLTTLDDKITAEKSKLTASRQFKKALLQRMFV